MFCQQLNQIIQKIIKNGDRRIKKAPSKTLTKLSRLGSVLNEAKIKRLDGRLALKYHSYYYKYILKIPIVKWENKKNYQKTAEFRSGNDFFP